MSAYEKVKEKIHPKKPYGHSEKNHASALAATLINKHVKLDLGEAKYEEMFYT